MLIDTAHDTQTPPQAVWFVPLIQAALAAPIDDKEDLHQFSLEGLLVAHVVSGGADSGGSKSQYRRIGYIYAVFHPEGPQHPLPMSICRLPPVEIELL